MKNINNKIKLIFFLSFVLFADLSAQVKNVLWLGNSFTGGTELNKYVKGMINAGNSGITINLSESNILWGLNLNDHWRDAKSMEMIRSKKYDYVVLQGYINMADIGQASQRENAIKYGILLADEIRANNGKPIIFCAQANENNTASQWDYVIGSYKKLSDTSNSIFAPASVSWLEAKEQDPTWKLFTEDGHHQNEFSYYLNMCVFYYTITGQSPVGNPYRLSSRDWNEKVLKDDVALKLQQYAASVVERMKGTEIKVTGLMLTPTTANIMTEETIDLNIKFSPVNASNRRVTWTSSNTAVATVNALGAVTGITIGMATITAKSDEGMVSATSVINVVKNTTTRVTSISLDKVIANINIGDSINLIASILPLDATNKKIKWLSSNYVAVNVDATGKVKGILGGFSKITATTVDGSFVAVCTVYIKAPVIARGDNFPGEGIDKLTNGNLNDKWLDFSPTSFVLFSYDKNMIWNTYEITSANDAPERDPKDWTISGSTDGVKWTVLDTRTGETWSTRNLTKSFSFTNFTPYNFYKWDITANGSGTLIQASEFKFSNSIITTITDQWNTENITLYPNPSTNQINFKFPNLINAEINIIDIQGHTLISTTLNSSIDVIDISHLDKGIYFVRVNSGGYINNLKFIKK